MISVGQRHRQRAPEPAFARSRTAFGHQVLAYTAVGSINTALDFGVFAALVAGGANPYIANVVGFSLGAANSYVLNRLVTFRDRRPPVSRARLMAFAAITTGLIAVAQLVLFAAFSAGAPALAAKAVSILVTTAAGFALNRGITFRGSEA